MRPAIVWPRHDSRSPIDRAVRRTAALLAKRQVFDARPLNTEQEAWRKFQTVLLYVHRSEVVETVLHTKGGYFGRVAGSKGEGKEWEEGRVAGVGGGGGR